MGIKIQQEKYKNQTYSISETTSNNIDGVLQVLKSNFEITKMTKNDFVNILLKYALDNIPLEINEKDYSVEELLELGNNSNNSSDLISE